MGRPKGYKHSEETRLKMSLAAKGKAKSEIHKQHMRESALKRGLDPEWRKKLIDGKKKKQELKEFQLKKVDVKAYVAKHGRINLYG